MQRALLSDNLGLAMMDSQKEMKIPAELIPRCPNCGKPLTMNLRADDKFVEDSGWHKAAQRYEEYLKSREGRHILFLELGVGMNTPSIIKFPFRRMTANNPKAFYVCLKVTPHNYRLRLFHSLT